MQAILVEDDFVSSAALFTARKYALAGHFRRHTGESFIHHPRELASLLSKLPHNREMLATAWIIQSVKDEYATTDEVALFFGDKVSSLVTTVSSFNLPENLSNDALNTVDLLAVCQASDIEQTIALADLFVTGNTLYDYAPHEAYEFATWLAQHLAFFSLANSMLMDKVTCWVAMIEATQLEQAS